MRRRARADQFSLWEATPSPISPAGASMQATLTHFARRPYDAGAALPMSLPEANKRPTCVDRTTRRPMP
jgi:hypothetical protein